MGLRALGLGLRVSAEAPHPCRDGVHGILATLNYIEAAPQQKDHHKDAEEKDRNEAHVLAQGSGFRVSGLGFKV